MKKLLFAIAGAAAFSAFADPAQGGEGDISWVGFEAYDTTTNVVGQTDNGQEGTSLWTGGSEDNSFVKTYAASEDVDVPTIPRPALFAEEENTKYLALDTNGSELQRTIPSDQDQNVVPAAGMYIDTLVQFTPSESAPTSADLTGAKLAIWLGVVEGVTNLYVQGNAWDIADGFQGTPQAFALSGKTIDPGTWYRLTVKAIPNVLGSDTGSSISAFQISVDGTDMTLAASPFSADMLTTLAEYGAAAWASADIQTAFAANKLVPAIQEEIGTAGDPLTLTSVGFKGTGALDDFVVTTEAPAFGPAPIDFSLTWPAGLTAVSYQIGENAPVAISGTSPFAVPGLAADDVVKFIVANADGAQKTLTGTAGTDAGIDATGTTFGWPEYLGDAVDGAYEIDNLAELKLFQKGIATTTNELKLATAGETFKLTADIALDAAWPGVGVQNGKDIYSTADFNAAAFQGTFDGQNHTISGFQMVGGGLDYCGFFNSTYGATIQNLKIAYAGGLFAADTHGDSSSGSNESGATFVGVAKNSTLRNLTTVAGTVSCYKGFGGIVGYLTSGTLVDSCTNNVNMTSLKPNKCGGIAMITQGGSAVTICNCQNNGSVAGSGEIGSAIGYIGLDVTISNFESTVAYKMFQHQGSTVTLQGTIKGNATVDSYTGQATPGLNFATVDGSVATFVADGALAAGNNYKVMHTATATYEFAAAGSISFDTNLIQAVTFAITAAQGLDAPTETTENGVVTFTVAAAGGDDYAVEIEGSDVVITPSAEDLAAVQAAVIAGGGTLDVTDVAAVNAALAAPIGTTGIPAWQALFLGVAPTEAGLETVAIKSVSFDAEGKVVVEMADGVELKTGRGVDIKLKLMGSSDLTNWTQIGSDITNTKAIPAVTPGSGETKKFYKVVVDFAGSSN